MSDGKSRRDKEKGEREEWSEAERRAEHKIRMRFEFRDLVEDLIQEGQERGAFDNLAGRGKPLNLDKNLYEGERELANALMKEHNVLPVWLVRRNAVQTVIDALRQDLLGGWRRHEEAYRLAQDDSRRKALSLSWWDACRYWERQIVEINKEIDEFNLRRPSDNMELFKLRLDLELNRAGARRDLAED